MVSNPAAKPNRASEGSHTSKIPLWWAKLAHRDRIQYRCAPNSHGNGNWDLGVGNNSSWDHGFLVSCSVHRSLLTNILQYYCGKRVLIRSYTTFVSTVFCKRQLSVKNDRRIACCSSHARWLWRHPLRQRVWKKWVEGHFLTCQLLKRPASVSCTRIFLVKSNNSCLQK